MYGLRVGAAVSVKIFISCVSDEFGDYRDQLKAGLESHNVQVFIQEDFKGAGFTTVANDDVYIRASDVVVHLAGDMTGWMAQPASNDEVLRNYPDIADRCPPLRDLVERGAAISYTQWEAWLALYHDKRLLIAVPAEGAPRNEPEFAPTPEQRAAQQAAQQAHLARLGTMDHWPDFKFASADQLINHVLTRIRDLPPKPQETPRSAYPYSGLLAGLLVLAAPIAADQWAKTLGVAIAAPLALALAGVGFALALVYGRYFGLLGASDGPAGSRDRQGYDVLRENLATGGPATLLYARWLTAFLDRVDHFFGDASMADRTLFPHAFGLKTPAPLWTAPAFDRCLLLAIVYPILTIFIMWAVSGDVGPAEAALGLKPFLSGWKRGTAVAAIGMSVFALLLVVYTFDRNRAVWFSFAGTFASAVAGAVAVSFVGVVVAAVAVAGALAVALVRAVGGGAAPVAFAVSIAAACAFVGPVGIAGVGAFAGTGAVAFAVGWLHVIATRNQRLGVFLLHFVVAMTSGCLAAAYSLASLPSPELLGPLLLFLVLLTLLNAPFDWMSLGLTRALLRRGLELKAWWPFFLAVADALCAAVIISLLALTMVIGIQTFDTLAVRGGGKALLPLAPLFDGIAAHPEAPEYWWVYALLLSTMIPSLINLAVGGTALTRAVPGLPSLLLRFLPATSGVPGYNRAWIAAVLTLQAGLGAFLGVAVQGLVAWGLIFHAMPAVGLGLLDLARGLAALDLPARVIGLVAGVS
jgi:hypothetical protein